MLHSCEWQGNRPVAWDAKLLKSGEHLPEDLKRALLGSRRRILFVEGTANSLDLPLYGALQGGQGLTQLRRISPRLGNLIDR